MKNKGKSLKDGQTNSEKSVDKRFQGELTDLEEDKGQEKAKFSTDKST